MRRSAFYVLLVIIINITRSQPINQYVEETGLNGEDIWRSTSDFEVQFEQSYGTIRIGKEMTMEFDFIWHGYSQYPVANRYEMFFRVGFNHSQATNCPTRGSRYPSFWMMPASHSQREMMHVSISSGGLDDNKCHDGYALDGYGKITIGTEYHVRMHWNDTIEIVQVGLTTNYPSGFPEWQTSRGRIPTHPDYIGLTADLWWMSDRHDGKTYSLGNGTFRNIVLTSRYFTQFPTLSPTVVTDEPTVILSKSPSEPTQSPSTSPTTPSASPSQTPSASPSEMPSAFPSQFTGAPTSIPSKLPSEAPTTKQPSFSPSTSIPSQTPTIEPSSAPPTAVTDKAKTPSISPSQTPTSNPSKIPNSSPSVFFTTAPSSSDTLSSSPTTAQLTVNLPDPQNTSFAPNYCRDLIVEIINLDGISSYNFDTDTKLMILLFNATIEAIMNGAIYYDNDKNLLSMNSKSASGDINVTYEICAKTEQVLNVIGDRVVNNSSDIAQYIEHKIVRYFEEINQVSTNNLMINVYWESYTISQNPSYPEQDVMDLFMIVMVVMGSLVFVCCLLAFIFIWINLIKQKEIEQDMGERVVVVVQVKDNQVPRASDVEKDIVKDNLEMVEPPQQNIVIALVDSHSLNERDREPEDSDAASIQYVTVRHDTCDGAEMNIARDEFIVEEDGEPDVITVEGH